jgi:hypothetical protein
MFRLGTLILPLICCFTTGCYTFTDAPGATGKVIDSETGSLVRGAKITRVYLPGEWADRPGVESDGLLAATALSDKYGSFNLPPALHTQIAFMYLRNLDKLNGDFVVSADGYGASRLHGVASSHTRWRVRLGQVSLTPLNK